MGKIKDGLYYVLTKKTKEVLAALLIIAITFIIWLLSMMVSYDPVHGWRLNPSMQVKDLKEIKK